MRSFRRRMNEASQAMKYIEDGVLLGLLEFGSAILLISSSFSKHYIHHIYTTEHTSEGIEEQDDVDRSGDPLRTGRNSSALHIRGRDLGLEQEQSIVLV